MGTSNRAAVAILLGLCAAPALWAAEPAPPPRLALTPCRLPGVPDEARCGTYEVFENRDARAGRKITLNVAVLPALGPDRVPDPIVFFDGGPGEPSVASAGWHQENLLPLRARRDILLVDARGTGRSASLDCEESAAARFQGYLDGFMPVNQVRACRDLLRQRADLSQYTTERIVDDMAEVSAALGYEKVNAMGVSYGTRAVLVFLRRHPGRVRAAVLSAVVPTDTRVPLYAARDAQRSLETVFAECAREPACAAAFPDPAADLATVLRQVEQKPVPVEIADPETGQKVSMVLNRSGVVQTLRYMLYNNRGVARILLVLSQAARGNFAPLGEMAHLFGSALTAASWGMYLSVTCAEDVAFIREEEIAAAVAGTFLGDFRARRQIEACREWPAAKIDPGFLQPVVSDTPVLAFSGARDPATPPGNGEQIMRHLKRGRLLVVPHGAHRVLGGEGAGCPVGMIRQFLDAASAEGLDTSCLEKIQPVRFVLPG
jgi:pimeloyl-ACP methyl ester carboxylesterase